MNSVDDFITNVKEELKKEQANALNSLKKLKAQKNVKKHHLESELKSIKIRDEKLKNVLSEIKNKSNSIIKEIKDLKERKNKEKSQLTELKNKLNQLKNVEKELEPLKKKLMILYRK